MKDETDILACDEIHRVRLMANTMRRDVITMISEAKSGHPGGSLSCVDILATLFFGSILKYNIYDPMDRSGDRFFLSKGHAAPALYAAYHRLGWIEDYELQCLRKIGSRLQGHPDSKYLPAVEVCSGSLGQGLAVGCGVCLGFKMSPSALNASSCRHVYVLCGDGEMQEGSVWEAVMFAAHSHLDNMTLIIDMNGLQIDGTTDVICSLGDMDAKLRAFGWSVSSVDGHDIEELLLAFSESKVQAGRPHAIICRTIKGKGVSYMEGKRVWHGKAPSIEEAGRAQEALSLERESIMHEVMA